MKRALKITGIFLAVIAVLVVGGFLLMQNQAREALSALKFEAVDMKDTKNGGYEGEADAGLVKVKVKVTIKDHEVSNIELLEHKNGLGKKAEVILRDMVAANTYDVDVVSGATLLSQTMKSAVNQALKRACSVG